MRGYTVITQSVNVLLLQQGKSWTDVIKQRRGITNIKKNNPPFFEILLTNHQCNSRFRR